MLKLFTLIITVFLISCASDPVVDTKGINQAQYQIDLEECKQLAEQVSSSKQALKQGAFGAVVYGAMGLVLGSDNTRDMAGLGAVAGAAGGASQGSMESGQVLRNCLRNRGYVVLN